MRASRRAAELGSSEDALLSGSCPCRICTGWRKARRSRCRVVPRMNRAGWSEPSVCYFPPPTPASTSAQSSLQVSAPPHDPRHMTLSHFQGLRPKGRFDTAGCFQEADETNGWTNGISKAGQRGRPRPYPHPCPCPCPCPCLHRCPHPCRYRCPSRCQNQNPRRLRRFGRLGRSSSRRAKGRKRQKRQKRSKQRTSRPEVLTSILFSFSSLTPVWGRSYHRARKRVQNRGAPRRTLLQPTPLLRGAVARHPPATVVASACHLVRFRLPPRQTFLLPR